MSDRRVSIDPLKEADLALVRNLFEEYVAWLNVDLDFQGFEAELAELPGAYKPPQGGLWLARVDDQLAGCIALRPLDAGRCEMKRLWVRDAFRGFRLGGLLVETAVTGAKAAGYEKICLDTLEFMDSARRLYERMGFYDIPAYYHNPLPNVRYMELNLSNHE